MATKVTIQAEEDFEFVDMLGARAWYVEGETEEYYPALEHRSVELPGNVKFSRTFRIKDESALSSEIAAKTRAREFVRETGQQAVVNMVLSDWAQEP